MAFPSGIANLIKSVSNDTSAESKSASVVPSPMRGGSAAIMASLIPSRPTLQSVMAPKAESTNDVIRRSTMLLYRAIRGEAAPDDNSKSGKQEKSEGSSGSGNVLGTIFGAILGVGGLVALSAAVDGSIFKVSENGIFSKVFSSEGVKIINKHVGEAKTFVGGLGGFVLGVVVAAGHDVLSQIVSKDEKPDGMIQKLTSSVVGWFKDNPLEGFATIAGAGLGTLMGGPLGAVIGGLAGRAIAGLVASVMPDSATGGTKSLGELASTLMDKVKDWFTGIFSGTTSVSSMLTVVGFGAAALVGGDPKMKLILGIVGGLAGYTIGKMIESIVPDQNGNGTIGLDDLLIATKDAIIKFSENHPVTSITTGAGIGAGLIFGGPIGIVIGGLAGFAIGKVIESIVPDTNGDSKISILEIVTAAGKFIIKKAAEQPITAVLVTAGVTGGLIFGGPIGILVGGILGFVIGNAISSLIPDADGDGKHGSFNDIKIILVKSFTKFFGEGALEKGTVGGDIASLMGNGIIGTLLGGLIGSVVNKIVGVFFKDSNGDGKVGLSDITKPFKDHWNEAFEDPDGIANKIKDGMGGGFLGTIVGGLIGSVVLAVKKAFTGIKNAVTGFWKKITSFDFLGWMTDHIPGFKFLRNLVSGMEEKAAELWDKGKDAAGDLWEKLKKFNLIDWMKEHIPGFKWLTGFLFPGEEKNIEGAATGGEFTRNLKGVYQGPGTYDKGLFSGRTIEVTSKDDFITPYKRVADASFTLSNAYNKGDLFAKGDSVELDHQDNLYLMASTNPSKDALAASIDKLNVLLEKLNDSIGAIEGLRPQITSIDNSRITSSGVNLLSRPA